MGYRRPYQHLGRPGWDGLPTGDLTSRGACESQTRDLTEDRQALSLSETASVLIKTAYGIVFAPRVGSTRQEFKMDLW